jgi:predicted RNase H-like HicB family nuclease
MTPNDLYTYRVTRSAEDAEYVGTCVEFPGLSWLAPESEAALQDIHQSIPTYL